MSDFKEQDYWDKVSQEFDTYYKEEKHVLRRAIDKVFRKGLKERYDITLQECKNINGKKILDIGCGTGRMSIELAKKGARVVGMDFSRNMLEAAMLMAKKGKVEDRCTFILDNFAQHVFSEKFHVTLALGVFDYTEDPAFHLKKMRSVTTEKCLASFPAKFVFQVPLRMIWLRSRSLPVYFYTKGQLKRLFAPHFSHLRIKNISAGYFCVASVQGPNANMARKS